MYTRRHWRRPAIVAIFRKKIRARVPRPVSRHPSSSMPDSPNLPPASPPATTPAIAPATREQVIASLTASFVHDQLSLDEFDRRVAIAYSAATPEALAALTADLPAGSTSLAAAALLPSRIAAVVSNVERSGVLTVPEYLEVRALAGNVELDLRHAHFAPGVTEIALRSLMGSIDIRLPAYVQIDNQGSGVLASFECHDFSRTARAAPAGAPPCVVRVTGRVVLSAVTVVTSNADTGRPEKPPR
jgi:hypothetical protein